MNAPMSPGSRIRRADFQPSRNSDHAEQSSRTVRVMIVDDSLTVRTIFKRMVEGDQGMAIVGTASSAERAIMQLKQTPADVVLLDLEMPGMGGLEALPEILKTSEETQVLVVSSLTDDGAEATMSALSMGAADTMLKPRPGGFNEDYRKQLLDKIRALGGQVGGNVEPAYTSANAGAEAGRALSGKRPHVLAIGASTGGIHALNILLRALSTDFDLPIVITQHLPASFIPVFARQIEIASGRPTVIGEEGTEIKRGAITIATGHGHMAVRKVGDRLVTKTLGEPAPSGCLPSVDPMLSSLATACEGRVLAVILSGMGRDGLRGAQELVEQGGAVFAQDAETSAVWGMPGAVSKAGLTSLIAPPEKLAEAILAETLAGTTR